MALATTREKRCLSEVTYCFNLGNPKNFEESSKSAHEHPLSWSTEYLTSSDAFQRSCWSYSRSHVWTPVVQVVHFLSYRNASVMSSNESYCRVSASTTSSKLMHSLHTSLHEIHTNVLSATSSSRCIKGQGSLRDTVMNVPLSSTSSK